MFRTPEMNKARYHAEINAGKEIGHTQKIEGVTMDDTCVCSCGWKSNTYWDGNDLAYADWVTHIKERGAIVIYPDDPSQIP